MGILAKCVGVVSTHLAVESESPGSRSTEDIIQILLCSHVRIYAAMGKEEGKGKGMEGRDG